MLAYHADLQDTDDEELWWNGRVIWIIGWLYREVIGGHLSVVTRGERGERDGGERGGRERSVIV